MSRSLGGPSGLEGGIELYDGGRWFEAHEVWEDHWRAMPKDQARTFVQGLIQLAVSLEHHRRGNPRGATGQREKAGQKLVEGLGNPGIDIAATLALADAVLAGIPGVSARIVRVDPS